MPPLPSGADEDAPGGRSCSSSGPAPWRPASRRTPASWPVIAEIVRRLDGLPLAIELAAARLHTLDVAEVAAGLDRRFLAAVVGLPHVVPSRLAGRGGVVVVRAARRAACNGRSPTLSVFAGSFTAADAAAVCGVERRRSSAALDAARRALAGHAGPRPPVRVARDAAGVRRRAARRRRPGRATPASATLVTTSSGSSTPTGGLLEPGRGRSPRSTPPMPELRTALGWLLDHDEVELAGRLVAAPARLRVPAAAPRRAGVVGAGDRRRSRRPQPAGAAWCGSVSAYAAWMAGDVAETGVRSARACRSSERAGRRACRRRWRRSAATSSCSRGASTRRAAWYRRAAEPRGATIRPSG